MRINDFAEKMVSAVKAELGAGYRIELKEVRKNNGVLMHGLMVFSERQNVVPTIYLESFWEAYENGISFAAIVKKFLRVYREQVPVKNIDMEFFRHFDRVRDRICYRLVRVKGNEELLRECPYVEFLDLAICFFYAYNGMGTGEGSILIRNAHSLRWGAKTVDLMRLAEQNTVRLFEWECVPMDRLLRESAGSGQVREDLREECIHRELFEAVPMRVLTNTRRIHGAVCMLYPGLLEKLALGVKKNLYILPSSIHEVILLEDTGRETAADLRQMIREVNVTQVAPEEVLSDSLYYYDFKEKKVKIIY